MLALPYFNRRAKIFPNPYYINIVIRETDPKTPSTQLMTLAATSLHWPVTILYVLLEVCPEAGTAPAVLSKIAKACRSNVSLSHFRITVLGPENSEKI